MQPLQGFAADMAMALMRRVERAAEQPDPPWRQEAEARPLAQGRT
ncbi:MAG: hypothetical protein ACREE3_01935 [Stellaceae bacterium]